MGRLKYIPKFAKNNELYQMDNLLYKQVVEIYGETLANDLIGRKLSRTLGKMLSVELLLEVKSLVMERLVNKDNCPDDLPDDLKTKIVEYVSNN